MLFENTTRSIPLWPIIFFLLTSNIFAQQVAATKVEESITVDGHLTEAVWAQAEFISRFTQFEPRYGEPSPFETIIRIAYDRKMIYFGIECIDPEPGRISTKITRRDGEVWEDDSVAILLDTYHDKNNAYVFMVNALGTQQDERWADNGRTRDIKWDTNWRSAGTKDGGGWTAEVAIPFEVLRFDGRATTWGLNAIRWVPRNLEKSTWVSNLTEWFRIAEFGTITDLDFTDVEMGKFTFIPYVQAQFEEGGKATGDLGLDVRYNITSGVAADGTINPDFATIEADLEQVNLTRFELSYPEKRPFFLEGAESYQTRIKQFYSRRVGEIPWGTKLNGKIDKWKFNMLATQSDPSSANPSIDPGKEAYYTVFRAGYDLKNGSNIGLIGANRYYEGASKGSFGMVGTFFFTDIFGMTTQVIKSYGDSSDGSWTYFFRPSFDSRTAHFHVRYTHVGENVRENMNEIGFIRDDDRREFDTNLRKQFWINNNWLESIKPSVNYNQYWSQKGELRSWVLSPNLEITFLKNWTFDLEYKEEYKLFEKDFRNSVYGVELEYDTKVGHLFAFSMKRGTNFDRNFDQYGGEINLRLREGWNLAYELEHVRFQPDYEGDSSFIHNLRTTYYINKDLFLKFLYQSRYFLTSEYYDPQFDQDRQTLQCIFVWRFLPPFGQIQLSYLQGPTRVTESSEKYQSLFAKLAWVFQK